MSKLSDGFYKKLKLRGLCTEKPTAVELKGALPARIKQSVKTYGVNTMRDSNNQYQARYKDKEGVTMKMGDSSGNIFKSGSGVIKDCLADALAVLLIKLANCGENHITKLNYRKKLL